ncbi:MAG TPA: sigma-70 family RNA polymerase sigma factor [Xanthomonadales bacterium]|nr:sigma-70 family RNA polymerase sigma factor [Xanthomonadales bacterium]
MLHSTVQPVVEHSRELVERIGHGDRTAESELIARYARGVRLILLKRTGNPQLASDLCQDTFVVTLRKLRAGELRNSDSLAAFISQTAVNLSIQHFRKEVRYEYSGDGIIELQPAHSDKNDEQLDSQTTRVMLDGVLKQLAVARDREILRRFYLSDDDKDEICRDLQLSSAHFDRVLYRAKQRMRELIDQQKGLKALLFGGLLDA